MASPQPSASGGDVLGEVLVNNRTLGQGPHAVEEDPDLALAKMLQAQEQAWLAMAGSGASIAENLPPSSGEAGGEGPGGEGAEGEELTDEEMARRLQEEEEREFQARLLAMAGVGVGPAAAVVQGGDAGEGDEEEYLSEDDVDPDEMTYEELTALGEAVGTVSKGIAQAEIDALPTQQYYEVAGTTEGSEEQCPICRVEYEPEDTVKVLPLCRHYYHCDCIGEWLKLNKVCCICNREVIEEGKTAATAAAAAGGASAGSGGAAPLVLGERRQ